MAKFRTANSRPPAGVTRRVVEIACGLIVILMAIGISRIWIEAKNSWRADSFVLRRSIQLTLDTARYYGVDDPESLEIAAAWERFLAAPPQQDISPQPAHEFVDSFMVKFRDGVMDSLEASELYHQLMTFRPGAK